MSMFRYRHSRGPVPLKECVDLQRRAAAFFSDPGVAMMHPNPNRMTSDARALCDAKLAQDLRDYNLAGFVPPAETLNWLIAFLQRHRPRRVLEFGSGITTYCMAMLLGRMYGPQNFRLLSFDQEVEYAQRTRSLIRALPSGDACRIVHAPLYRASVAGRITNFYNLRGIQDALDWLGKSEFVFIDGPFSDGPCRYGTLPIVRLHLALGAHFVMDDAFREKELFTASLWDKEGFQIDGVVMVGEGLLVGRVPGEGVVHCVSVG
jgi:predicted O-methyltransferase YrrM